jgi:hypothetical protein
MKGFGFYHGLKQIERILEEMCPYHTECNGILTLNLKIVTDIDIFVWQFEISFLVYEGHSSHNSRIFYNWGVIVFCTLCAASHASRIF